MKFDEEKWLQETEKQASNSFNHEKINGKYFSSWRRDSRNIIHKIKWAVEKKPKFIYDTGKPGDYMPENKNLSLAELKNTVNGDGDFIIWIGHNTSFMKINNEFFLVDPVFSEKIFFTKRETRPGIDLDMLNEVLQDKKVNILITHNHYDHLDKETLKQLKFKGKIFFPKGLKNFFDFLSDTDFEKIEMDWWEERSLSVDNNDNDINSDMKIVFLPAQHYSLRLGEPKNSSLWGSYMIVNSPDRQGSIFIGGDSGYFNGYREYGKKYKVKTAVVPVGGYERRWFAAYEHLNVEESLKVMEDLNCEVMIPVHWGTSHLGDEPVDFTGYKYSKIFDSRKELRDKIYLLDLGEIRYLK